jgi:apolipoprotein N-acyltransferase
LLGGVHGFTCRNFSHCLTDLSLQPSLALIVGACFTEYRKSKPVRNICRADGAALRDLAALFQALLGAEGRSVKKDYWLYGLAATSGILVWVIVSMMSGRREAWDSAAYFQVGIPALCLVSAVMGYISPDRTWRWGAIPLGAQIVWMSATQGLGNLFPLGLIVGGILAVPPILTARLGAFLRHRRAS